MAVESILLDRMLLGEEIHIHFVETVLMAVVEIWNDKIEDFKTQLAAISGPQFLAEADALLGEEGSHGQAGAVEVVQGAIEGSLARLMSSLQPIEISRTENGIKHL